MTDVRRAHLEDAKQLAKLAERTFRDTFAAMNTQEDMDLHCRASYGEAVQAAEIADPAMETLVCSHEGRLIGYAQLRWGHPPPCVSGRSPGEIQRLYVAKEWHGMGVAQRLMDACISRIEERGADVAWLGVWERNPRAIAFYKKWGFVEVGDHVFPLGTDPQRDIIMVRPVSPGTDEGRRRGP